MRYFILEIFLYLFMSSSKTKPFHTHGEKNLRICLGKEPVSLDPRKENDIVASQVQFMLFEGLLCLNPDMSLSHGQAESYEVSSDGKTYTFHLRDALWSDGTPVTAYDFEKSWKSLLDPDFPSPDAYLVSPIKNAKLVKAGKVSIDQIGITSKDAKTLIVELESPTPYFLQIVASSVLLPINTKLEAINPNWASHTESFFSNGPFQLKKWEFNQQLVLEKNPLYHKTKEVHLEHIFIDIIDRKMAVLHMHDNGYYDLVGSPLSFFSRELLEDPEKKKLLTFFPVATTKFLAFNTSSFPFQNTHIRRAFAYAISRKTLVEHITKLHEQEALNIIPPVLFPEDSSYFSDGDISKAQDSLQKGLKELKIDHLGSITFMYVSSEPNHALAQELQQTWVKVLGIEVVLQQVEFKILHERSKKKDFSIGLFAWLADYSDPMSILDRFMDKTNHRNYPKWESGLYNRCLEEALKTSSPIHYMEKIKEAERILIDEMPFTCLFHENFVFLIHPHVQGFAISPLGHIYFDRISIDPSKRKFDTIR